MIFADLAASDSICLDANILIHHFTRHPRNGLAATSLVQRIEQQELIGLTLFRKSRIVLPKG